MPDAHTDIIASAASRAWEKSAKTFYHGSTTPDLKALQAKQPNMGGAGVYGTDNLDWAALYALAKDRKGMAVIGGANPKLLIYKNNALLPEGHVYEYDSDTYTPPPETDPNRGWAVPHDVTPTKTHKVKLTDHMRNIEQFDDKDALRKRFAELAGKAWAKQAADPSQLVLVSGHSGSGKSTVAQNLATQLGVPKLEIDHHPDFRAFLSNDPHAEHLQRDTEAGAKFKTLLQRIARETAQNAPGPAVIEGTQLAHLAPEELTGFANRLYVSGTRGQVFKQRLDRNKANYARKGKAWTPEVEAHKKEMAGKVYDFHAPEIAAYGQLPGTVRYNWHAKDQDAVIAAFRNKLKLDQAQKQAVDNTAVIIRGNPKFVANNPAAEAFYAKLQKHMEQQGYAVTQDAGEPHTVPAAANVWLGHSRGVDRFRFAPAGTRTIGLGAPGGINHPDDAAMNPGDVPTAAHYKLTPAMIKALKAQLQKHAAAAPVLDSQTADIADKFQPDYTPEQLESLGVYDALYRNQGPRLASLGEWKPEWVSEHDPKGWAQWYKRYSSGRRIPEEDERQIKRWSSFKARHGSSFTKNPTPRRGWALRNWGIDPAKLVTNDARNGVVTMLDDYQRKAMQKYVAEKQADLLPSVQLQEHQQRIADKVTADENRMLVYHGLGSGKSLSALAAAEAAKRKFGGNYGIVAPASLKGNFEKEIAKFTTGSDPEVMSYTGLGLGKQFQEQPDTLIMDEAHRLRNPGAASSQAAAQAAAKAKRLLLLTGSPVTNEPSDMANLLSLIHNKNITPEEFNRQYVGQKTVRPGIMGWLRGAKPGVKPVIKNEAELRKLLAGHVDYQASKTPDGVNVNEQTVRVPLSAEQQKIQKAIRTKIPPGFLWKLDNEFPLSREELSKLNSFMTGMRQVSLSTQPFRADKDPGKSFGQSAKLQEAFKNLQTTLKSDPRKKAIIYSNFVDSGLAPYASALEKAKVPHGFFHGGVSPKARQAAVDAYNAGKLRALLIGPAGAEGLSTKGTSLIQLLDPHWNETRSQQARGRGLRFDSHVGLPEELKNVAVQRYLSSSEDPSILGKLMGYKRERTGDEVLERLTAEKEQANEEFRRILREEGSKYKDKEKLAAVFNSMPLQSARLKARMKKLKLRPSNVKLRAQTPTAPNGGADDTTDDKGDA